MPLFSLGWSSRQFSEGNHLGEILFLYVLLSVGGQGQVITKVKVKAFQYWEGSLLYASCLAFSCTTHQPAIGDIKS